MRWNRRTAVAASLLSALLMAAAAAHADNDAAPTNTNNPATQQSAPGAQQTLPASQQSAPAKQQSAPATQPPEVTVLTDHEVQGILGREVRSATDENMGRIVDVLVDRAGQVRAAIIDFGGFLGVGSRKIAVDWKALHFPPPGKEGARITLELTRDQVAAAPQYQEGKPVVVLGALGKIEPLPFAD
jgi:PRC-barrel domain